MLRGFAMCKWYRNCILGEVAQYIFYAAKQPHVNSVNVLYLKIIKFYVTEHVYLCDFTCYSVYSYCVGKVISI